MSPSVFPIVMLFAAFALAFWIDARWPRLAPTELRMSLLHLVGAFVFGKFASWGFAQPSASATVKLILIYALVLPAVIYLLLACMWMLKVAQGMISAYRGRGGGGLRA